MAPTFAKRCEKLSKQIASVAKGDLSGYLGQLKLRQAAAKVSELATGNE